MASTRFLSQEMPSLQMEPIIVILPHSSLQLEPTLFVGFKAYGLELEGPLNKSLQ
jgi:hypothetical protein